MNTNKLIKDLAKLLRNLNILSYNFTGEHYSDKSYYPRDSIKLGNYVNYAHSCFHWASTMFDLSYKYADRVSATPFSFNSDDVVPFSYNSDEIVQFKVLLDKLVYIYYDEYYETPIVSDLLRVALSSLEVLYGVVHKMYKDIMEYSIAIVCPYSYTDLGGNPKHGFRLLGYARPTTRGTARVKDLLSIKDGYSSYDFPYGEEIRGYDVGYGNGGINSWDKLAGMGYEVIVHI